MTAKKSAGAFKIRITDTTLRDAHQSLWATRMTTDDILAIAEAVDHAGYYSLECWGGATFDVCLRFLHENPWERLRLIKKVCPNTPLQMLLRGQNILGYRNYPDDVLERFIALACENGMDIFRIFDALNDPRNLAAAMAAVKKYGGHAQGTLCYTISPVHTTDAFVALARTQESMGADSLCIKDMAGILTPAAATELVSALVKAVKLPVQLHSHMTSGMAIATYLAAVKAGAGAVDSCVATLSGFSSQPATETLHAIFSAEGYDTGLNLDKVEIENEHFRKLKSNRAPDHGAVEVVDVDVLQHHIPGGMISNLRGQLKQQDALDRLPEVLDELPRARADLGYPPLVTPTSQIVGVQAVLNVLAGERFSMVTQETRDYVRGMYGASPAPIKPALKKKILDGAEPITCRPADLLSPGLPTAAASIDPKLIHAEEDILSYCLFPEVALNYFKWRANPQPEQPAAAAPVEIETTLVAVAEPGHRHAEIGRVVTELIAMVAGAPIDATRLPSPPLASPPPAPEKPIPQPATSNHPSILAPLTGTFFRSDAPTKPHLAEEGAKLNAGQPICVIEAMKLFNPIKTEKPCTLLKFLVNHGDHVTKGQPIAEIQHH